MFCEEPTLRVDPLCGLHSGWVLANIRLKWKYLEMKNTLAYNNTAVGLKLEANDIKLFRLNLRMAK